MLNFVVISGVINGEPESVSNNGVRLNVEQRNKDTVESYIVVLYEKEAEAFTSLGGKSGLRAVIVGRIGSEKLGTENNHTIINGTKLVALTSPNKGVDFTQAVAEGELELRDLRYTPSGTAMLSGSLKNIRTYKDRKTQEEKSYTTYVPFTVWKESAEELSNVNGGKAVFSGILKPSSYENKSGVTINKVDIWVNDMFVSDGGGSGEAKTPVTQAAPAGNKPFPTKSGKSKAAPVEDEFDF